jgi:small-conductance mechanosensitive channel
MGQILDSARSLVQTTLITLRGDPFTVGELLTVVALFLGALWFGRRSQALFGRLSRTGGRRTMSDAGVYALARMMTYATWILVGFMAIGMLGFSLSSLSLFGGVVGVGLGLGLQSVFANFVSGGVLLLEKSLKVGDLVELPDGVVGRVHEINMRYTRVTTNDSLDVLVPNSEFVTGRVVNWTLNEHSRRVHVKFSVAYGSDKTLVCDAGMSAVASVPGTITDIERKKPEVWLVNLGNDGLEFELIVWVGSELVLSPARTHAMLLWELHDELVARGIEIPFPQRDLHLKGGPVAVQLVPPQEEREG